MQDTVFGAKHAFPAVLFFAIFNQLKFLRIQEYSACLCSIDNQNMQIYNIARRSQNPHRVLPKVIFSMLCEKCLYCRGVGSFLYEKFVCFCLVTVVDQIVLGPVGWPAKLHFATVFDLQNGKFSRLGMTHPRTPSRFVPVGSLNAHELSSNIVYAFKRGKSIFENFKQAYFEEE